MRPDAAPPVVAFVLWYRERRGAAWQKVGAFVSRAAALERVDAGGDWWLAEVRDPALLSDREPIFS